MRINSKLTKAFEWLTIAVGCFIFAFGISIFYESVGLAPGGASGIAIIINGLTGFPVGTAIFLINIPLFIMGLFGIGKEFLIKTVYATALSSVFIDGISVFASKYPPITDDTFLCAVFGGAISALGMGLVFKNGGSTGGTDIITKLIRRKRRDVPTGKIFLAVDSIVIALSAVASGNIESALFSAVALFISTSGLDLVLYGRDEAKFLVIISSKPEEVADKLLRELDVGVTYADGEGAYSGAKKKVIICAVKKHLYPKVKDMVKETDDEAFMIVSSASEIYGEGHKKYGAEEL